MTDWALIATSTSAGAASVGLIAREWQVRRRRRWDRDKQLSDLVQQKVDAKLGEQLASFIELRDRLEGSAKRAERDASQAQLELQASLESAQDSAAQLNNLIEHANKAIPDVMRSSGRVPAVLLMQLRQSDDSAEQAALVEQILSHPDSSSWQLEISGDIVQDKLQDPNLALSLYKRACEEDPENLHAKSEELELLAGRSGETARTALNDLIGLAKANPTDMVILANALNTLADRNEWQKERMFIEEMLPKCPGKSMLWRNLATCRYRLGDTDTSIREAFQQAVNFSRETRGIEGSRDFASTARLYSWYLMNAGDLGTAEELLSEAILYDPTDADLHLLIGDLWRQKKEWAIAANWYQRAGNYASNERMLMTSHRMEEIRALMQMALDTNAKEPGLRSVMPADGSETFPTRDSDGDAIVTG